MIFIIMSFLTIAIALIFIQIYTVDFFCPARRDKASPKIHEYMSNHYTVTVSGKSINSLLFAPVALI